LLVAGNLAAVLEQETKSLPGTQLGDGTKLRRQVPGRVSRHERVERDEDSPAEHPAAIKSSRLGAMGPRASKDFQAKSPRATATSKNASQPASDMARWACRL